MENKIRIENQNHAKAKHIKEQFDTYRSEYNKNVLKIRDDINIKKAKNDKYKKEIVKSNFDIYRTEKENENLEVLSAFYSPSGFRPLVLSHYSPILSECINYSYKDFTDGHGEITISSKDDKGNDKPHLQVNLRGKTKPFPDYWSKGECQAIDLSINFGLMRLASAKAGKDFNLIVCDEIVNGMSGEIINRTLDILREKFLKPDMTIIFISHYPIDRSKVDKVWTMVKRKEGYSEVLFNEIK